MQKLFEIYGKPKTEGDIGIEVECEGANLVRVEGGGWHTEDDGSLRPAGGFPTLKCEWVLDTPVPLDDVKNKLLFLAKKQDKATLKFGFRTSVHVHVNCQELTYYQLLNMIYIYFLYEEPLINFCGEGRKANRFCLRLRDAEGQLDAINRLIALGEIGLHKLQRDRTRYSALNLEALPKYGSLEFRGMRGTLDVPVLMSWVNMCHSIREAAKQYEDVSAVHDAFVKLGPEEFGKKVFGKEFKELEDVEDGAALGYSLSLDLPYMFKEEKKKPYKEYKPLKYEAPPKVKQIIARMRQEVDADLYQYILPDIEANELFEDWEARRLQIIRNAHRPAMPGRLADMLVNDEAVPGEFA